MNLKTDLSNFVFCIVLFDASKDDAEQFKIVSNKNTLECNYFDRIFFR